MADIGADLGADLVAEQNACLCVLFPGGLPAISLAYIYGNAPRDNATRPNDTFFCN